MDSRNSEVSLSFHGELKYEEKKEMMNTSVEYYNIDDQEINYSDKRSADHSKTQTPQRTRTETYETLASPPTS